MSDVVQKCREAYEEAMHTKDAFQAIREETYTALANDKIDQTKAFELAVTLRVVDAVQNKLISIVQSAEYEAKAKSIQEGE